MRPVPNRTGPRTLQHRRHSTAVDASILPDGGVWSAAIHAVVQEEVNAAYWRGYMQGQQDLDEGMQRWAASFADEAPCAVAKPLADRHASIVRGLVDRMVREGRSA